MKQSSSSYALRKKEKLLISAQPGGPLASA